jgi:hypothetical protein
VVAADKANRAMIELEKNLKMISRINKITVVDNVSVISIIGQDLSTFHKPYTALIKIKLFLFYSTIPLQVKCKFSG